MFIQTLRLGNNRSLGEVEWQLKAGILRCRTTAFGRPETDAPKPRASESNRPHADRRERPLSGRELAAVSEGHRLPLRRMRRHLTPFVVEAWIER